MHDVVSSKLKSDADVVKLVLVDSSFFEILVDRYEKKLKRYILRLGMFDNAVAEDLLQEVFIKVYQNLNDFDSAFSFSSWIYRISHNVVVSYFRKANVSPKILDISRGVDDGDNSDGVENLADDEVDLANEFDKKQLSKKVLQVLAEVPGEYREMLVLFYIEEKSYKEISDILKRPINTVSSMINRAKRKFKQIYHVKYCEKDC